MFLPPPAVNQKPQGTELHCSMGLWEVQGKLPQEQKYRVCSSSFARHFAVLRFAGSTEHHKTQSLHLISMSWQSLPPGKPSGEGQMPQETPLGLSQHVP